MNVHDQRDLEFLRRLKAQAPAWLSSALLDAQIARLEAQERKP